jgi:hypothetical protein
MSEEYSQQASETSDERIPIVIDTCAECGSRFTAHANGPSDVARSQPFRHESRPNDVLCERCFRLCHEALP